GEEPDAHHQSHDARRRELRDHAQADRTETELSDRLQEVEADQPPRADALAALLEVLRRRDDEEEREAEEEEAEGELRGARGLAASETHPDCGENRGENDDEERLHRLEPARWIDEVEDFEPCGAVGEERQARSGLLEAGPEDQREEGEDARGGDAAPLVPREAAALRDGFRRFDRDGLRRRLLRDGREVLLPQHILNETEDHSDAASGA